MSDTDADDRERCDQCSRYITEKKTKVWRRESAKRKYTKLGKFCGNKCYHKSREGKPGGTGKAIPWDMQ